MDDRYGKAQGERGQKQGGQSIVGRAGRSPSAVRPMTWPTASAMTILSVGPRRFIRLEYDRSYILHSNWGTLSLTPHSTSASTSPPINRSLIHSFNL